MRNYPVRLSRTFEILAGRITFRRFPKTIIHMLVLRWDNITKVLSENSNSGI
jgi:hypothetical protein